MLLFSDQGAGFAIYRTVTDPNMLSERAFSVERLGMATQTISDGHWSVSWVRDPIHYRTFYDGLRTDEKLGIIRLLDRLNRVARKETDNLKRWCEIMGLEPPKVWTEIVTDDCNADNPWSDTVAKIEALRKTDNTMGAATPCPITM